KVKVGREGARAVEFGVVAVVVVGLEHVGGEVAEALEGGMVPPLPGVDGKAGAIEVLPACRDVGVDVVGSEAFGGFEWDGCGGVFEGDEEFGEGSVEAGGGCNRAEIGV